MKEMSVELCTEKTADKVAPFEEVLNARGSGHGGGVSCDDLRTFRDEACGLAVAVEMRPRSEKDRALYDERRTRQRRARELIELILKSKGIWEE